MMKVIVAIVSCLMVGIVAVYGANLLYKEELRKKERSKYITDGKEYPLKAFDFDADSQYIIVRSTEISDISGNIIKSGHEVITNQKMIEDNIDNYYVDHNEEISELWKCENVIIFENGIYLRSVSVNSKGSYRQVEYGELHFDVMSDAQYWLLRDPYGEGLLHGAFHIEFGQNYTVASKTIEDVKVGTVYVHGDTVDGNMTTHEVTTYLYDLEEIVIERKGDVLEIKKYDEEGIVADIWNFDISKDEFAK